MKKLTPEQYHVLVEKGTEVPFSGKLLYNKAADRTAFLHQFGRPGIYARKQGFG